MLYCEASPGLVRMQPTVLTQHWWNTNINPHITSVRTIIGNDVYKKGRDTNITEDKSSPSMNDCV